MNFYSYVSFILMILASSNLLFIVFSFSFRYRYRPPCSSKTIWSSKPPESWQVWIYRFRYANQSGENNCQNVLFLLYLWDFVIWQISWNGSITFVYSLEYL